MWADSSSSPSACRGEKNPITHSAIPRCQSTTWRARHGHAAPPQHAQRAQVQRLGAGHQHQRARVEHELHALQDGANERTPAPITTAAATEHVQQDLERLALGAQRVDQMM